MLLKKIQSTHSFCSKNVFENFLIQCPKNLCKCFERQIFVFSNLEFSPKVPVSIIWFIIDFFSVPHSFVDYIVLSVVKEQPPHCKLHSSMFHLWLLASCMPFLVIFFPIPKLILQSPPSFVLEALVITLACLTLQYSNGMEQPPFCQMKRGIWKTKVYRT